MDYNNQNQFQNGEESQYYAPQQETGIATAIASFACGLTGVNPIGWMSFFVPIICGIIAIVKAKKYNDNYAGNPDGLKLAKAGKIMGWISIIGAVLSVLFWIVYIVFVVGLAVLSEM